MIQVKNSCLLDALHIVWTIAVQLSIGSLQISFKLQYKYKKNISLRKCIWTCRIQHFNHLGWVALVCCRMLLDETSFNYFIIFCILTYAIIYVLIHHTIFLALSLLVKYSLFFKYSWTNIFHKRSLCTFYLIGFILHREFMRYNPTRRQSKITRFIQWYFINISLNGNTNRNILSNKLFPVIFCPWVFVNCWHHGMNRHNWSFLAQDNLYISYTFYRYMMTSSNRNIFRVPGHLCGEFTGHRWIPRTKASDAELWCFLWSASE